MICGRGLAEIWLKLRKIGKTKVKIKCGIRKFFSFPRGPNLKRFFYGRQLNREREREAPPPSGKSEFGRFGGQGVSSPAPTIGQKLSWRTHM
jgi:hypothetical protein